MTLGELRDAINALLNEGPVETDRIGIELNGETLDVVSITVIVSSDIWEAGMVVMTADFIEEGEADDG